MSLSEFMQKLSRPYNVVPYW